MRIAAKVAADKVKHPEKFCPEPRCLWRTGNGSRCPRHGGKPVEKTFTPKGFIQTGNLRRFPEGD